MTTKFIDAVSIGGTKRTEDGYLIAVARCGRSGIQHYAGWEVGRPQMDTVRVYRPPEEVFADKALQSCSHAPITVDHPDEEVNADTWSEYAVGEVSTAAQRDGEWLALPLILKDAKAIQAVEAGKSSLSWGYKSSLEWSDGVTPEGEPYDAIQRDIKINHLSVVRAGRAGPKARIGDGVEDSGKDRRAWGASPLTVANDHDEKGVSAVTEKTTSITRDGLPVTMPEAAAPIVNKWLSDADKQISEMNVAHAKAIEAKDSEIGELKSKLKDAESKLIDDDQLDQLVADRAALVASVTAIDSKIETKGVKDAELRRRAVESKYGANFAKDASDAEITGMFKTLAKEQKQPNPLSSVVAGVQPTNDGDPEALRAAAHKSYLDSLNGVQAQKGA